MNELSWESLLIDRMNDAKNQVKHKRGHRDESVEFNAAEEAVDVIHRAISNFDQLRAILPLRDVPAIEKFMTASRQKGYT